MIGISFDSSTLLLLNLKTQQRREILRNPLIGNLAWSADSRYLYFDTVLEKICLPSAAYKRWQVGEHSRSETNPLLPKPIRPGFLDWSRPRRRSALCPRYQRTGSLRAGCAVSVKRPGTSMEKKASRVHQAASNKKPEPTPPKLSEAEQAFVAHGA